MEITLKIETRIYQIDCKDDEIGEMHNFELQNFFREDHSFPRLVKEKEKNG